MGDPKVPGKLVVPQIVEGKTSTAYQIWRLTDTGREGIVKTRMKRGGP